MQQLKDDDDEALFYAQFSLAITSGSSKKSLWLVELMMTDPMDIAISSWMIYCIVCIDTAIMDTKPRLTSKQD
jgi:hypothetical protein